MDIKFKLYPHPVLWDKVDDYKTSEFECDIEMQREIKKFVLIVRFKLKNQELQKMIEVGLAEFVLHIESPASSYRILEKSAVEEIKVILPDDKLLGRISLCPFVVAKEDVSDFYNSDWNEDYKGVRFQVSKGTVLAIATQQSFTVDKEPDDLSDLPSIFTIYKKETTEDMPVEVEIHSPKIRIGLNIKDYENYAPTKYGTQDSVNIVNAFLIYPALIFIFERLKEGLEEYEDYRWFKAIQRMFQQYSVKLDYDLVSSVSSLELAQKLMSLPVSKGLVSLASLGEREE
ncbi:MAG: hypothetical protein Q3993_05785 [Filifactor alocis]|nr:hypothetical protein [Filifactor alocis]